MLWKWHHETKDPQLVDRAAVCAGRCIAWDRCQFWSAGVEYWHGHWFKDAPGIDRSRLGYHARTCPLRDRRNVNEPTDTQLCCQPVFDSRQRAWLAAAQEILQEIEKAASSAGPFRTSLRIEGMAREVRAMKLGTWVCQAKHAVDPWGLSPRSKTCPRQGPVQDAEIHLNSALEYLRMLYETLPLNYPTIKFSRYWALRHQHPNSSERHVAGHANISRGPQPVCGAAYLPPSNRVDLLHHKFRQVSAKP